MGIRSKLTIAFVLVLLPFFILEFAHIRERTIAGRQAVMDSLRGSAQTSAATMDAFVAEIIRKEQTAAQIVMTTPQLSPEELSSVLAQVRAPGSGSIIRILPVPVVIPKLEALSRSLQPFAEYLAYVDSKGRVVASDPVGLVGRDMSAWPEVRAVLLHGQVWANSGFKANLDPAIQTHGFAVCLSVRAAAPTGAICAGLAAAALNDVLPAVGEDDTIVILDENRQLVHSSRHDELAPAQRDWSALPRQAVVEIAASPLDGRSYLGAQAPISSLGWTVGVYRQKAVALAPVEAATQREIVLFALIAAAVLLLSQVLSNVLVQPIVALTGHARQLSKGGLEQTITITSGDEMQTLGETFNSMAQNLNRTISDLLHAQQQIARQSEQLQQLLVRTHTVQEEERKRIALDIHDGVIQLVVAAGYELQAATRQVSNGNPEAARRALVRARQLMDQTVVEMRRIVFDLHPTSLDSRGLVASLQKYAANWQQATGIGCTFTVKGTASTLPSEMSASVYRIVQEALTNIQKHAGATQASITMDFAAGTLTLTVQDNGRGFSSQIQDTANDHLGLMSMSERARTMGGQLDVASKAGQGTTVVLRVPVPSAQADSS